MNKGLGIAVLVFAGLITAVMIGWRLGSDKEPSRPSVSTTIIGVPVIMRTKGGLLEVATVNITERLRTVDPNKKFLGVNLGETVTQIDVPATYKYNIELAPDWAVEIHDKTCVVVSPPIKASLPVAIDTSQLIKSTQSSWGRFNTKEQLTYLEKMITPSLNDAASSQRNLQLALEPARQTVKEFVLKWLIKEQKWTTSPEYQVLVTFSNESAIH